MSQRNECLWKEFQQLRRLVGKNVLIGSPCLHCRPTLVLVGLLGELLYCQIVIVVIPGSTKSAVKAFQDCLQPRSPHLYTYYKHKNHQDTIVRNISSIRNIQILKLSYDMNLSYYMNFKRMRTEGTERLPCTVSLTGFSLANFSQFGLLARTQKQLSIALKKQIRSVFP